MAINVEFGAANHVGRMTFASNMSSYRGGETVVASNTKVKFHPQNECTHSDVALRVTVAEELR
jgi:hypothetical protein